MPVWWNIEYKTKKRHDDYLMGLQVSPTHGGTIYIGKDDDGKTVGVKRYKKN